MGRKEILRQLDQLMMCAHGKCEVCVHCEEECNDRIDEIGRNIASAILLLDEKKIGVIIWKISNGISLHLDPGRFIKGITCDCLERMKLRGGK